MAINLPQSSNGSAVQAGNVGAALVPATGGQLSTIRAANDFQQSTEVEIRVTRTSGGTAGVVVIMPGAGQIGTFADLNTAGTAFVSPDWDGANAAENFYDYCKNVGLYVDGIRFDTDNVANYNYSITVGERMPNKQIRGKKVNLSKYRQATGNTYANTADFTDNAKYLVISSILHMEMSDLAKGSFFSIFLNVAGIDKSVDLSEVKL